MYVHADRGFGQVVPPSVQTAASIASTGIVATTSILTALTPGLTILGVAAPIVGTAVAALISIAIAVANAFKGCGQTCIQASNIANQVGALLVQNVTAYTSSPIRTVSMQIAALNTYDTAWQAIQQACGNPALLAAGQRCITDRQRGACTWKASKGGWNSDGTFTPWGAAGSGSDCWNWFVGMRDPIANDPFVQPDPSPFTSGAGAGSPSQSISSALSGIPTPLLLAGGLAVAAFALGGD